MVAPASPNAAAFDAVKNELAVRVAGFFVGLVVIVEPPTMRIWFRFLVSLTVLLGITDLLIFVRKQKARTIGSAYG